MRIFLTGYMASGKTTLGKAFAKACNLSFIDLDWYIEERMHSSVRDIFASRGEEGFRQLERNMLLEVSDFEDVVVACGGGTPCFFDNMEVMNNRGITVFLDTSQDVLFRRLKQAAANRPLVAGKSDGELRQTIAEGLEKRLPYYSQASIRLDGSRLESRTQIDETVEILRKYIGDKVFKS